MSLCSLLHNHALDVVEQEVIRECDLLSDVLLIVRDVNKIIGKFSKRRSLYEEEKKQALQRLALGPMSYLMGC